MNRIPNCHHASRLLVVVRVVVFVVCGAGARQDAYAQESNVDAQAVANEAQAKKLYAEGTRAYAEGRYEDAISKFEAAFELTSLPLLLYNISLAYERIGDYEKAIENLRGYVASAAPAERETIRTKLKNLKARAHAERQEAVAAKAAAVKTAAVKTAAVKAAAAKQPVATAAPVEPVLNVPAISLMATAGGFLVVSGTTGLLALQARSGAKSQCVESPNGSLCRTEARDLIRRDENLTITSGLTFVAALAAAGVGTYLLLWQSEGANAPASKGAVTLTLIPVSGGMQVGIVGGL